MLSARVPGLLCNFVITIKAYSVVHIAKSALFFSMNYSPAHECSEIGSHLLVHYRMCIAINVFD